MAPAPAQAASPPSKSRLKSEVATLKREVATLKTAVAAFKKSDSQQIRSMSQQAHLASALERHIVAVDPCPITTPTTSIPPGDRRLMHGNGKLWVGLWESNIVVWPARSDGSIRFGHSRELGTIISGRLRVH